MLCFLSCERTRLAMLYELSFFSSPFKESESVISSFLLHVWTIQYALLALG